jgi:soluble lytic murein transglycosylase
MSPRPLSIVLAALAATFATVACAQTPATVPAKTTPLPGAPLDPQLARVRMAIDAAERGTFDASEYADLARHPLYGWIEYASLRRGIDTLSNQQAQDFLNRHGQHAVGEAFREIWLAATARREDWRPFLAAWKPTIKGVGQRCTELNARQALGRADSQWVGDAQAIWRSSGKTLPDQCDAPLAVLTARGGLTDALRWQRIDAAAAEWQPAVMRSAARGLPAGERALAEDYAAFLEAVHDRALTWPKTERSRRIASHGLARLGKSVPVTAEAELLKFAGALGFSDEDRAACCTRSHCGPWLRYELESARRLDAARQQLRRQAARAARAAISRSDWRAALAAIRKMGTSQRSDSRWQYFEARLAGSPATKPAADRLYTRGGQAEFHGSADGSHVCCAHGYRPTAARRRTPSRAIRRWCARWAVLPQRSGWAVRSGTTPCRGSMTPSVGWPWTSRRPRLVRPRGVRTGQESGRQPEARRVAPVPPALPAAPRRHHPPRGREEPHRPGRGRRRIRAERVQSGCALGANPMGLMQVLPLPAPRSGRTTPRPAWKACTTPTPTSSWARHPADARRVRRQPYFAIAGYNAGPAPSTAGNRSGPEGPDPG